MQRPEVDVLFADFDNFVRNENARFEVFAAVKHSVAHCGNLFYVLDCAVFRIDQSFKNQLQRLFVRRHVLFYDRFSAVGGFLREDGSRESDAFANSLCQNFLVLHVDDLIFKAAAAGVYNQNFHIFNLP